MKDQIVLRDKDVYAKVIMIDDEPIPDVNSVPYMRFSYDLLPFIMREPAYKCWRENNMAELVLTKTDREVNGKVVEALSYGGHLTVAQDVQLEKNMAARDAAHADALREHQRHGDASPKSGGYEQTKNRKKDTPYPQNPDPEAPNQPLAGTPAPNATPEVRDLEEPLSEEDTPNS